MGGRTTERWLEEQGENKGGGEVEEKRDEKGVKNGWNADLWSDIFLSGGRDVSSPRSHLIQASGAEPITRI